MTSTSPPPRNAVLERQLGPVAATSIIVGGIIGSGIFISPSIVAREVGAPGLSLLVWGLAAIIAVCGALCYAELSAAFPETGGTYVFLKRAYGAPIVAFLFGWTAFFASFTGAIAAVATAFAEYAGFFLARVIPYDSFSKRMVALSCIVLLTALNYVSVRWGAKTLNAATLLKVLALVGVVAVGLLGGAGSPDRFVPLLPSDLRGVGLLAVMGTALIPALFAFNGWTYASYVGGEVRRPQRNLPLAVMVGIGIVLVVYLLVNVAFIYVLPFDQLVRSTRPAADVVETVLGPVGGGLVAAAVMVSTFGAANAVLLACARIYYRMSRDGVFFKALDRVHPRFRTPANAVVAQGVVASAFALSGTFEQILTYYAFIDYAFFSMAVAAVIILRRKLPDLPRPYRVWGYPWPAIIFLSVMAWYLANTLTHRFAESMVGILLTLSGVPFYLYWTRRQAQR